MIHIAPLTRDKYGRPIVNVAVGGRCNDWLVDSGASLSIIHSESHPCNDRNTIALEGFDGTVSLASQSGSLSFQIGQDTFKEKAWFSTTGDARNILGSDIMKKRGYIIDYGNNCIWRNPQHEDNLLEISDVHAVHAIKKAEDYDLDALLSADDFRLSDLLKQHREVCKKQT